MRLKYTFLSLFSSVLFVAIMVLMEVVSVDRGWTLASGIPVASAWKGPISEANVTKVQNANHPDVFFAATSDHKTVPFKYRYINEYVVGLDHIYEYHRKTTGDVVLVRPVSEVPFVISIRVIRQFYQYNRITGSLLSGEIVFLKDVHLDEGCKAYVLKREVHDHLIQSNRVSKLRKVRVVDENAFEVKGNRWVVKPRR